MSEEWIEEAKKVSTPGEAYEHAGNMVSEWIGIIDAAGPVLLALGDQLRAAQAINQLCTNIEALQVEAEQLRGKVSQRSDKELMLSGDDKPVVTMDNKGRIRIRFKRVDGGTIQFSGSVGSADELMRDLLEAIKKVEDGND